MSPTGGHCWGYSPGNLSCSRHLLDLKMICSALTCFTSTLLLKSICAWFLSNLQWLELKIGHQASNLTDGHRGNRHPLFLSSWNSLIATWGQVPINIPLGASQPQPSARKPPILGSTCNPTLGGCLWGAAKIAAPPCPKCYGVIVCYMGRESYHCCVLE